MIDHALKLYQERTCDIPTWFTNHVAEIEQLSSTTGPTKATFIKWYQPGSYCYWMRFVIVYNRLFVYGDLGEAVYSWSDEISPEFIAGLDLDYFASKCDASDHGRGGKEWDNDVCQAAIISLVEEVVDEKAELLYSTWVDLQDTYDSNDNEIVYPEFSELSSEVRLAWHKKAKVALVADADQGDAWQVEDFLDDVSESAASYASEGEEGWSRFVQENPLNIGDVWEYRAGRVIAGRTQSHLIGFKLAYAQLKTERKL